MHKSSFLKFELIEIIDTIPIQSSRCEPLNYYTNRSIININKVDFEKIIQTYEMKCK